MDYPTMVISTSMGLHYSDWMAEHGDLTEIMLRAGRVIGRRKFQRPGPPVVNGIEVCYYEALEE